MSVSPQRRYLNDDAERKSSKNRKTCLTAMENASVEKHKYTVSNALFLVRPSHSTRRARVAPGIFRLLQAIHLDSVAFSLRETLRRKVLRHEFAADYLQPQAASLGMRGIHTA
jgi:hypothetical protein